jgi:hypothetical protein
VAADVIPCVTEKTMSPVSKTKITIFIWNNTPFSFSAVWEKSGLMKVGFSFREWFYRFDFQILLEMKPETAHYRYRKLP